jgi:hypothetical protein
MRKLIAAASLLFIGLVSSAQATKENGTIYINHPNIDAVNKSAEAYLAKDIATNSKIFSDTAKFWVSGMEKQMAIADAFKLWASDFDYYDGIKITPVGYPDYLHYTKDDQKIVQSWWHWEGKSKKTGAIVKIDYVQFDQFDATGKITAESIYGDFSKLVKE